MAAEGRAPLFSYGIGSTDFDLQHGTVSRECGLFYPGANQPQGSSDFDPPHSHSVRVGPPKRNFLWVKETQAIRKCEWFSQDSDAFHEVGTYLTICGHIEPRVPANYPRATNSSHGLNPLNERLAFGYIKV